MNIKKEYDVTFSNIYMSAVKISRKSILNYIGIHTYPV